MELSINNHLLPFLALAFVLLLLYFSYIRHKKELLEFYSSLGARHVGYKWLFFPLAELDVKGKRVKLYTEGGRGSYALKVSLEIETFGYLKLWRGGFLDKLTLRKPYLDNIFVEYEEKEWAERLLNMEEFKSTIKRLFELPGLTFISIDGRNLTLGWHLGGISRFKKVANKEVILEAIRMMVELSPTLNTIAPSKQYKENLRSWLTLKLPILITVILSTIGIVGGFYRYDPLCTYQILLVGFKILTPINLLYTVLVLLLVGGPTLDQRVFFKTLFVCFVCTPLISLFFLLWVNGRFDRSEPEHRTDTIVKKYHLIRGGYRIALLELHKNRWCGSFKVSEGFYIKAEVGSKVEYAVKKGFLGVPWLYRKLTLIY